ncbi:hypothetical protein K440DRAFT_600001, partial [Wilcoxina mikolae CBS 423.85]
MDRLFGDESATTFVWYLKVELDGVDTEMIEFKVENINGIWKADATELDAALSLWAFDIQESEDKAMGTGMNDGKKARKGDRAPRARDTIKGDWLQRDVELKREVTRMLGPDTEDLRRDIGWWIDGGLIRTGNETFKTQRDGGASAGFVGPIGFVGLNPGKPDLGEQRQSPLPLKVTSAGSLEHILSQHIFTAFMWALAKSGVLAKRIYTSDQTTVECSEAVRLDTPQALLSLKLVNKVLMETAKDIQRCGLGNSLQEVYMCLIPPLSCTKRLPIEAMVDFVRQQMKESEVLGRWEKVIPVYIAHFRICKLLPHGGSQKATAIMIHLFLSVSNALGLRQVQKRDKDVEKLQRLRDEILHELKQEANSQDIQPKPSSLRDLTQNFAKLYYMQKRLYPESWNVLASCTVSEDDTSVHTIFQHPAILSTISTISAWNVHEIGPTYANTRDILGWGPLHYAAARSDQDVIHQLLTYGSDPKATDLDEWTPLHYAIE